MATQFNVNDVVTMAKRKGEIHVSRYDYKGRNMRKQCMKAREQGLLTVEHYRDVMVFKPKGPAHDAE